MASRTRVPRWTPPFRDALRLAWRPALAFNVFVFLGSCVMLYTIASQSHGSGKDVGLFLLGLTAGGIGILLGQVLSILRFRAFPVFVVTGVCMALVGFMLAQSQPPGGEYVAVPLLFFCFAFPCGLLSLMHRWELFASFWPSVMWIGSAIAILNDEGRVSVWEKNKVMAWLPLPLVYLGCFLVLWLVYLAAKQASRVEMWQALSGAAARRVVKKEARATRASALPKKNLVALLVVAILLFAVTAVLAPYLWRTGRGDREGKREEESSQEERRTPKLDTEGLVEQMMKLVQAAKETLPKLWPLLLLVLLYRPTKRAFLLTHLKAPIIPTPPSERIDNLWEYVRIAAEDAGAIPTASDSVEELLNRLAHERRSASLQQAAEIYVRTRYGFTVQQGDPIAMRTHALAAADALREDLSTWARIRNWWRPLS